MLSYEGTDFGCRSGINILIISGLVGSQFFPTGTAQDRRGSHDNQDPKVSAFVWVISTFTELTKISINVFLFLPECFHSHLVELWLLDLLNRLTDIQMDKLAVYMYFVALLA